MTRIADLTLADISSDGSGNERDLAAFKAAARTYRDANACTDDEAIDAIFGDGDFYARMAQWAPDETAALDAAPGADA